MESIPVSPSEDRVLQALWKAGTPVTSAVLARASGEDVSVTWHILRRLHAAGMVTASGARTACVYQLTRAGADYACEVVAVDAPAGPALPNQIRARAAGGRDAEVARQILAVVARRGWPAGWPDRWRDVALARMGNPEMTWAEVGATLGVTRYAARCAFDRLYRGAITQGYLAGGRSR